jgi:uncharacterized protein (DUF2147 family)
LLHTRWATEEKTVIQISEENHVLTGRQISSKTGKSKSHNGTVVLKNIKQKASNEFTGTLIDPTTKKSIQVSLVYLKMEECYL